jgi:hypothetical protein
MSFEDGIKQLLNMDDKGKTIEALNNKSLETLLADGYFEPDVKYPKSPKKPYLPRNHTVEDVKTYTKALETWENALDGYKAQLVKYNRDKASKEIKFKFACFYDMGWNIHSHPCHAAYSRAYEYGHSAGLYSVLDYCQDMDYIIKAIKGTGHHGR